MKKLTFFKQALCLFLCLFLILSIFTPVSAAIEKGSGGGGTKPKKTAEETGAERKAKDGDDNENFYTQNWEDLDAVYDGKLSDILDPLTWLTNNKTYIVVRKYHDKQDGNKEKTKVYVNTPNVQQYLQNEILGYLRDGYDEKMFTPESKINGAVGKDTDLTGGSNVINKFGYSIPVNRYSGEYSNIHMSMTNILPTKWYQALWAGLKSLFGYSVIETPDADNFKSLSYYGNEYYDGNKEKLIQFVMQNWRTMEEYLWSNSSTYFADADDVKKRQVEKERYDNADSWLKANAPAIAEAEAVKAEHDNWVANYSTITAFLNTAEGAQYSSALAQYDNKKKEYKKEHPELFRQHIKGIGADLPVPPIDVAIGMEKPTWLNFRPPEPPALTPEQEDLLNQAATHRETVSKFIDYIQRMNTGTFRVNGKGSAIWDTDAYGGDAVKDSSIKKADKDKKNMYYSQCLLKKTKDDEEENFDEETCTKTIGGQEYHVTIEELYVNSGAYKVKPDGEIKRADAVKIINKITNYLGASYSEAMSYFVVTYLICAYENGVDINNIYENSIDPRVMPYDVDSLIFKNDKELMTVVDDRVEIYKKTNFIGGIVTSFRFNLLTQFINYNSVAKFFINLGGKITSLSVFFNQICNFQWIEDNGLSPATMWGSFAYGFLISILMIFLIISIVKSAIGFIKGREGAIKVIGKFLGFTVVLGFVLLLTRNPDDSWGKFRGIFDKLTNFGENVVLDGVDNIDELYGDGKDSSVNYYIPYFNLWTLYNTGYNLNDPQQKIDVNSGQPEVDQFNTDQSGIKGRNVSIRPRIATKPTELWSVVLADSFNENGENQNSYGLGISGKNGGMVNKNAYRVVDHFVAPRITCENPSDADLGITNTQNENYNGQFQNISVFSLLGGFVAIINTFLISLIKMLTFLWFWWMLYMFIFNVVLGAAKSQSGKGGGGMGMVLAKTFSPLLFIIFLGVYMGFVVQMTMFSSGLINFIINLGLLVVTSKLVTAWSNTSLFPATLKPMKLLLHPILSFTGFQERRANDKLEQQANMFGIEKDENGEYKEEDFITETGELLHDYDERKRLNDAYREQLYQRYRRNGSSFVGTKNNKQIFSNAEMEFFKKDETIQKALKDNDKTIKKAVRKRDKVDEKQDKKVKIKNKKEEKQYKKEVKSEVKNQRKEDKKQRKEQSRREWESKNIRMDNEYEK